MMNMISFANFENFDLSGAAPLNGELPEGTDEFSALLTSFSFPQPQTQSPTPVSVEVPPTDIVCHFPATPTETLDALTPSESVTPANIALTDAEQKPAEMIWRDLFVSDSQTKPWQDKFGIDRIAAQAVEGVIKTETPIDAPIDATLDATLADSAPTKPDVKIDPALWASNTRPDTPDYKKHLQVDVKVKPDVIVPGDTPPIIVPPTVPTKEPPRPTILNYENSGEIKKMGQPPVVIPIIVPPVRTSFDGPPLEQQNVDEFPDGPTGVNESGDVLTELPYGTGGIKPPRETIFPFDGPPREAESQTDVVFEPTGVQVVEDVRPITKQTLSGIRMTPFEMIDDRNSKTLLAPRLDGGRIRGFELTPADVQSIAGTFESFVRPENIVKQEVAQTVKPVTEPLSATTFQEIAESIRASVQAATENGKISRSTGIVRAAEVIAEIRPAINAFRERATFSKPTSVNPDAEITAIPSQAEVVPGRTDSASFSSFFAVSDARTVDQKPTLALDPRDLSRRDLNEVTFEPNQIETDNAALVEKNPGLRPQDVARAEEIWQQQQVNPKQIEAQVSPHLLELAALAARKNEKQSLKMRLHPAELGSVEIRLERNDTGQINAFFRTESEMAQTALSQNMESLRETLQNAGWQVGQFEVSNGGGSATAQHQHDRQDRGAETFAGFSYDNAENSEPAQPDKSDRLLSLLA